MGRDQLGDVVRSVTRSIQRPRRNLTVFLGAEGLRQRLVGTVADQRVAERELEIVREARRIVPQHELLHTEAAQAVADLAALATAQRRDGPGPEDLPDDGGIL